MKYKDFRNFKIERNCTKKYIQYRSYLPYLGEDFKHRCAYCNMHDEIITENYRVDHFIPQTVLINTDKESLIYDYNNLMYCCPKCNGTKSSQYKGNIHDGSYNNELFYNPVEVDYNKIFYRNEYGGISSEDKKGKEMIINLKLFSPIYNFSFLIEEITETLEKLNKKIETTTDISEKEKYNEIYRRLDSFLLKIRRLFNSNYYNNSIRRNISQ